MSTPEAQDKTIVGVCEEIEQKPGSDWVGFKINVGSQYPVKLSTKLPALIEQARAVGGELATWTFKETDGNENPNRPGTFYKNRWLNKVEVGQTAEPTAPTTSGNQPRPTVEAHHKPIHEADKQRVISRLSCLSTAVGLYGGEVGEDPPLEVMRAAARFETWVYRDIDPIPSRSGAATPPPPAVSEPPQYEDFTSGPSPDDDIPFRWHDSYRMP